MKKHILAAGVLAAMLIGVGIGDGISGGVHQHEWIQADCSEPMTCILCKKTKGTHGEHQWTEATYWSPKICSVCGRVGEPELTPWFEENGIQCEAELNRLYPVNLLAGTVDVDENVVLTEVQFFESDEEHEAMEGYEWVKAVFEIISVNQLSWINDTQLHALSSDYYNPCTNEENGQYTVSYNGKVYDKCYCDLSRFYSDTAIPTYGIRDGTLESYTRIPQGYDGLVIVFYNPTEEDRMQNAFDAQNFDIFKIMGTYFRITHEMRDDNVAVLRSGLPANPDMEIDIADIVRCSDDYEVGFTELKKVNELAEVTSYDMIWDCGPVVYQNDSSYADAELKQTLSALDEGVYEAVVVARKENIVKTAKVSIMVNGTAPNMEIVGSLVKVSNGEQVFYDPENIKCVDDFYGSMDCLVYAVAGFNELNADIDKGALKEAYTLTYLLFDPSANVTMQLFIVDCSYLNPNYGNGKNTEVQTKLQEQPFEEPQLQEQQQEQPPAQAPADGSFDESMAQEALEIINNHRAFLEREPLAWSDDLYETAKIRAQELVTLFSHTRPGGGNFAPMLEGRGYTAVGENIAWGQRSATEVFQGWYSSEGHRANMEDTDYTQGAIACWYQNGAYYWVNIFAK